MTPSETSTLRLLSTLLPILSLVEDNPGLSDSDLQPAKLTMSSLRRIAKAHAELFSQLPTKGPSHD